MSASSTFEPTIKSLHNWYNNYSIIYMDLDFVFISRGIINIKNDLTGEIVLTHKLCDNTRNSFGIITIPEDNMIIYVHHKYLHMKNKNGENYQKTHIIIEFYTIENNIITKVNEYKIFSDYPCNNTTGRLTKITKNTFSIVWGDTTNNDTYKMIIFDKNEYKLHKNIFINLELNDNNLYKNYYYNPRKILYCIINAYLYNQLSINIFITPSNTSLGIINVKLPTRHRYKNTEEIENYKLIEIEDDYALLLRVKLVDNIDILHLKYYYLDILLDIDNNVSLDFSQMKEETQYYPLPFIKYSVADEKFMIGSL